LEPKSRAEHEAHAVSPAAWDNPSPVIVGETFRVKVGAKCAAGCALGGREVAICDETGARVGSGLLGESPWEGTTGLYWALVELAAPSELGIFSWSFTFVPTELPTPHGSVSCAFSFVTVPPPVHVILLRVVEKGTQVPVDEAHVRLGPYRASTDPSGAATLAVAAGEHTLFVGKPGYDAETIRVDVRGDRHLQIEATRLPEENPDAYWQG
jgi:hypothetical protein